jgi:hypothetical protein
MLLLLFATPLVAQDSETDEQSSTESTTTTTDEDSADEIDDDILDDRDIYLKEAEDDFVPSDEVTFEQSVPFPTDI